MLSIDSEKSKWMSRTAVDIARLGILGNGSFVLLHCYGGANECLSRGQDAIQKQPGANNHRQVNKQMQPARMQSVLSQVIRREIVCHKIEWRHN